MIKIIQNIFYKYKVGVFALLFSLPYLNINYFLTKLLIVLFILKILDCRSDKILENQKISVHSLFFSS